MSSMSDFVERFNREGGPVPLSNADHLASMWRLMREVNDRSPNKATYGFDAHVGLDARAAGIEGIGGSDFAVLSIRVALLQSLVERNVISEPRGGTIRLKMYFARLRHFPAKRKRSEKQYFSCSS